MNWIAPSGKDSATDTLEKRLWASADQFRADPPFNVNAVDAANCEVRNPKCEIRSVRQSKFHIRHPSRLWIQIFYSALKNGEAGTSDGRTGFFVASSASDARASKQQIWQKFMN